MHFPTTGYVYKVGTVRRLHASVTANLGRDFSTVR